MLTMLAQIKKIISEEEYIKLKSVIEEDYLKKRALYAPLNYQELLSLDNNLVGV